jgi:hypothetical protein
LNGRFIGLYSFPLTDAAFALDCGLSLKGDVKASQGARRACRVLFAPDPLVKSRLLEAKFAEEVEVDNFSYYYRYIRSGFTTSHGEKK